jgi:hypothetical protein
LKIVDFFPVTESEDENADDRAPEDEDDDGVPAKRVKKESEEEQEGKDD